jgi:putative membrane protein
MQHLLNVARGFLMGSADVVPGVSGGTVALVLGIYERLVQSIRTGANALWAVARGRPADFRVHFRNVEWPFVIALLGGIGLAVGTLASLIERLLEEQPQNTSALFFGLVAGSIVVAWRLVDRWSASLIVAGLAVAAGAFAVLGLRSEEISDPGAALFFGAGAVAIVAMILPGISGSFILLILGMYEAVLAAVNDRRIGILVIFLIGAMIGLAIFSTLLDRLLRDHRAITVAVLIGLMAGSLRVLWPWPDGTETATLAAPSDATLPVLLAVVGTIVVVTMSLWVRKATSDLVATPPSD